MATFYNSSEHGRTISQGSTTQIPKLSTKLDSIRPYQFEVEFFLPSLVNNPNPQLFTLAAKQVTEIGYTVEDIEVHRVNDRYYYPGKASPEEVTITFDNLKNDPFGGGGTALGGLYSWCRKTYDPLTGHFGDIDDGLKTNMKIHQLDEDLQPIGSVTLYGAYPKSFKTAEFNYSTTTDMHTLTVSFRYDFMSAGSELHGFTGPPTP
jgi:hypothetical protein